jgi:hypothetical protein
MLINLHGTFFKRMHDDPSLFPRKNRRTNGLVITEETMNDAVSLFGFIAAETQRIFFWKAGPEWFCGDAAEN